MFHTFLNLSEHRHFKHSADSLIRPTDLHGGMHRRTVLCAPGQHRGRLVYAVTVPARRAGRLAPVATQAGLLPLTLGNHYSNPCFSDTN